jgi:hypothetical protein
MLTVVVVLVALIVLVAWVFIGVKWIKPEDFKISAVLLKMISLNIEIKTPRSPPE